MRFFDTLKDSKTKVEYILSSNPRTRDSDSLLIATFYFHEAGGENVLKNQTAFDFLKNLSKGDFTPAASIIRVRRKLQEQIPALRGNNYEERSEEGEDVRNKIKNL